MTKHYDSIIDSVPGNIYQLNMFEALDRISVCNCVNISNLNRDWMKEISFFKLCLPGPGSSTKTTGIAIYSTLCLPPRERERKWIWKRPTLFLLSPRWVQHPTLSNHITFLISLFVILLSVWQLYCAFRVWLTLAGSRERKEIVGPLLILYNKNSKMLLVT
jgi:hypothetical protein